MLSCEQDILYFTIIPGYLHLEDVRALFFIPYRLFHKRLYWHGNWLFAFIFIMKLSIELRYTISLITYYA